MKTKKIKAWAIIAKRGRFEVLYGTTCEIKEHQEEYYLAVFANSETAEYAMFYHKEFYSDCKIVPIIITPFPALKH